jgi:glutaredoxin
MKLTTLEAAVLERLRKYRTNDPTLGERLRLGLAWMLVLLTLCVALAVLLARVDIPGIVFLPIGFFLGVAGREIGSQRRFIKWWPINREITDWNRVEQLLNGDPLPGRPEPVVPKTRVKWAVALGLCGFVAVFGLAVMSDQALAYVYNPTRNNPPRNVIVLSASWCPYCASLRRHLVELNVPYTELDVDETTEGRYAFYAVRGTGIPITIVGKHVLRGVGKHVRWQEIDAALKEAGYTAGTQTQPATTAAAASPGPSNEEPAADSPASSPLARGRVSLTPAPDHHPQTTPRP